MRFKRSKFVSMVEGVPHMSRETLLEYELAQAKVVNALQAIGIKKAEIASANAAHLEAQRLANRDLTALVTIAKDQEDALRLFQQRFQKSTGLDVQRMTYDDKTGRITLLEDTQH